MKKQLIIFISSLFVFSTSYAGGPWPQAKSKGYFKLSEWWTIFDQHFTDTGQIDPNVTTGVFNTNFYGEFGITDRFTVLLNASLFSRNYMNNLRSQTTTEIIVPGEGLNSLGDIDLGFKYGLTQAGAKIPVAISLTLGIPSGKTAGGSLENLQTGDGEFNQMLQIDAGRGFKIGNTPSYLSSYVGFNHRTNDFSEELRLGFELGLGLLNNKLWVNSKVNIVESLKNGATAATANSASIFANNTEYASIAFEANYYLTKSLGFSAGMAGAFRGEVIAARPSYTVGVFYDMK